MIKVGYIPLFQFTSGVNRTYANSINRFLKLLKILKLLHPSIIVQLRHSYQKEQKANALDAYSFC